MEYQGSSLRHLRPGVELVRRAYTDPAFVADGPKAYVASVCDVALIRSLGPLGNYTIPGSPQSHPSAPLRAGRGTEEYGLLEIEPRVERVDIGLGLDGKYGKEFWPARKIAEDVVGLHAYESFEKWGVFVCAGEGPNAGKPTDDELARARARLTETYQRMVFEADQLHARPNGFRDITDVHRRAAKWLGQERPWAYTPQQLVPCPGCGERLVPTVAVCKHCGAVLDREKAEALGIVRPEEPKPEAELATEPQRTQRKK